MQQDKSIEHYFYNTNHIIGKGSFGCVYRGINQSTQGEVAIKIMKKANLAGQSYQLQALANEMTILRKLHSKNIVRLLDVCENQQNYYLIQEYCQQGDLRQILKQKQLEEQEAIRILHDILCGYQILLKNGIVHRDIKPENILNSNGVFKLGDFGMATQFSKQRMLNSRVGTPLYMSPQVQQNSSYTNKCDIWSIGILFYECLYGATPWYHETTSQLLKEIQEQPLRFPKQPKVSDISKSFIRNCLQINEKERIDWIDILSHNIFRQNPIKRMDQNFQQIIMQIKNIIKMRKLNINQLIQNNSIGNQLKIKDLELLLISIDKQFTSEDAHLIFGQLSHFNSDSIPLQCVLFWLGQNQALQSYSKDMSPARSKQQEQSKVDTILNALIARIRLNSISIIQLFNKYDIAQDQEISLDKFEQIMLHINIQLSKPDISLCYRRIKEENSGSLKREALLNIFYEESDLDDTEDDFSVSPVQLPIQGPGQKLISCNNVEMLS
ncbi:unnamed protein product (macronuclear) [Paramecium tetraurelia]|uniref:Protein kinase domain-containing protein n=1 Tax=Paramecium tetraurelia TaxID=5888 RepID=A0DLZ5_PARTE|nr:uncharacterized protein GSPATT00018280001 [Paramecium tetraurelia]CAK84062.1 unnamed protein product [Paramecium tetraurelia]|eukprot:XP_001451459.1 hypothetical protein (macronuclear) [Paramecium tetraurelia strain d4-2]